MSSGEPPKARSWATRCSTDYEGNVTADRDLTLSKSSSEERSSPRMPVRSLSHNSPVLRPAQDSSGALKTMDMGNNSPLGVPHARRGSTQLILEGQSSIHIDEERGLLARRPSLTPVPQNQSLSEDILSMTTSLVGPNRSLNTRQLSNSPPMGAEVSPQKGSGLLKLPNSQRSWGSRCTTSQLSNEPMGNDGRDLSDAFTSAPHKNSWASRCSTASNAPDPHLDQRPALAQGLQDFMSWEQRNGSFGLTHDNGVLRYNHASKPQLSTIVSHSSTWSVCDDDFTLFVGDLPRDTSEVALRGILSPYGDVVQVVVKRDPATGHGLGYGFVSMKTKHQAERAIESLDNFEFGAKKLRVSWAERNTALFVGDLDNEVTRDELMDAFRPYGELNEPECFVKQGKCYGFVKYLSRVDAETAKSEMNGAKIGCRCVRVGWGHSVPMKHCVYVDFSEKVPNQPVSSSWMEKLFSKFGTVCSVHIPMNSDANPQMYRGYGFVHFEDNRVGEEATAKAVAELHNKVIDGVKLQCRVGQRKNKSQGNASTGRRNDGQWHGANPGLGQGRVNAMQGGMNPAMMGFTQQQGLASQFANMGMNQGNGMGGVNPMMMSAMMNQQGMAQGRMGAGMMVGMTPNMGFGMNTGMNMGMQGPAGMAGGGMVPPVVSAMGMQHAPNPALLARMQAAGMIPNHGSNGNGGGQGGQGVQNNNRKQNKFKRPTNQGADQGQNRKARNPEASWR